MEATVAAIEPGRLAGTAAVPPSKSAAHRAVVCAALAAGTSHIGNVEFSQDILATLGAAQQLGAKVERGEHELTITGRGNADGFATITRPVFCNESGSTLRFILPLFSLTAQKVRLPSCLSARGCVLNRTNRALRFLAACAPVPLRCRAMCPASSSAGCCLPPR